VVLKFYLIKNTMATNKHTMMWTTDDVRYAKKWYPKNTTSEEQNIREYLPFNTPADPRIADRYGEEGREDDERINRNDPSKKRKNKQAYVEEYGDMLVSNMRSTKTKEKKITSSEKGDESLFMQWEEYDGRVVKIDDFGNATVSIKGTILQGLIYNARKIWLAVGMKRNILFARTNKKGKYVFELPKNPEKIVDEYYNMYADNVSQEDIIDKLNKSYGRNQVKNHLQWIVDEHVFENDDNAFVEEEEMQEVPEEN